MIQVFLVSFQGCEESGDEDVEAGLHANEDVCCGQYQLLFKVLVNHK